MDGLYGGFGDDFLVPAKNVPKEMQQLSKKLTSLEIDWEVRVGAVEKIKQLSKEGDPGVVMHELLAMKDQLELQLKDLRSSVIKAVCNDLGEMSSILMDDFESLADALLPALMKLLVVSKVVISQSGDLCIRNLLKNCGGTRLFDHIISFLKERNPVVRMRCYQYAKIAATDVLAGSTLKKYKATFLDLVRGGLDDSGKDARRAGAQLYWAVEQHFPQEAAKLYEELPTIRQKLVSQFKDENAAPDHPQGKTTSASSRVSAGSKQKPRKKKAPARSSGLAAFIKNKRKQSKSGAASDAADSSATSTASTGSVEVAVAEPTQGKLRTVASEPSVGSSGAMFAQFPALSGKAKHRRSIRRGGIPTSQPVLSSDENEAEAAKKAETAKKAEAAKKADAGKKADAAKKAEVVKKADAAKKGTVKAGRPAASPAVPQKAIVNKTKAASLAKAVPSKPTAAAVPAAVTKNPASKLALPKFSSQSALPTKSPAVAEKSTTQMITPPTVRLTTPEPSPRAEAVAPTPEPEKAEVPTEGIELFAYRITAAKESCSQLGWPERMEAFFAVREACEAAVVEGLAVQSSDVADLAALYSKHISSDTYQVRDAALIALTTALTCFGAGPWAEFIDHTSSWCKERALSSRPESANDFGLFSAVLLQSRSTRDASRRGADRSIREFLGLFSPALLLNATVGTIDQAIAAVTSLLNTESEQGQEQRASFLSILRGAVEVAGKLTSREEVREDSAEMKSLVEALLSCVALQNDGITTAVCHTLQELSESATVPFSKTAHSLSDDWRELLRVLLPDVVLVPEVELTKAEKGSEQTGEREREKSEGETTAERETSALEEGETTVADGEQSPAYDVTEEGESSVTGELSAEDIITEMETVGLHDTEATIAKFRTAVDAAMASGVEGADADWFKLFPRALSALASLLAHEDDKHAAYSVRCHSTTVKQEVMAAIAALLQQFSHMIATLAPLEELVNSIFQSYCGSDFDLSKAARVCLIQLCVHCKNTEKDVQVISGSLLSEEGEGAIGVARQAKGLRILVEVFSMLTQEELEMWLPFIESSCLTACKADNAATRMAGLKCVAAAARAVPDAAASMQEQLCGYQKRMLQSMLVN